MAPAPRGSASSAQGPTPRTRSQCPSAPVAQPSRHPLTSRAWQRPGSLVFPTPLQAAVATCPPGAHSPRARPLVSTHLSRVPLSPLCFAVSQDNVMPSPFHHLFSNKLTSTLWLMISGTLVTPLHSHPFKAEAEHSQCT